MALHPILLSAAVGLAALGALHSPAVSAQGYVSISVGAPYDRGYYGRGHHRADHVWVPAHWVSTHHGRVWVPAQYVRVRGGYDRYGRGYDHGFIRRHDYYGGSRVIHRSGLQPLPGGFYYQRGGGDPRHYHDHYPRDHRDHYPPPYRGW